jgi:hypothetical protein
MVRIVKKSGSAGLALIALILLAGPASSAQAGYVHAFSSSFTPGGGPGSVAVDETTGNVYVLNVSTTTPTAADVGKIYKFDAAGNPINFSGLGTNSIDTACNAACRQIAVDNSKGINQGVIYVSSSGATTLGTAGVGVFLPSGKPATTIKNTTPVPVTGAFCGVAVDSSGAVYVTHSGSPTSTPVGAIVEKYQPPAWVESPPNPAQVPPITATLLPGINAPCKTAVDSLGSVYLIEGISLTTNNAIKRYPASAFGSPGVGKAGQTPTVVDPLSTYPAIDPTNDDLYADHRTSVARFDPSGGLLETFGSYDGTPPAAPGELTESFSTAINSVTKVVYASDRSTATTGVVNIYTPRYTPEVDDLAVSVVAPGSASFSGSVDPIGEGDVIDCDFEYRVIGEATFTSVPCDQTLPYTTPRNVSATASALIEGVTYQYRLAASNGNGTSLSSISVFKVEAPALGGSYASDLSETGAVLHGAINPNSSNTSYHFEYGATTAYGNSAPIPDGALLGDTSQKVSVALSDLEPHILYHFRIVATNAVGTTVGDDQTFHFLPTSCPNATLRQQTGSSNLPDCRAYELVSPGNAGNVLMFPGAGIPAPYASNPSRLAWGGSLGAVNGTDAPNSGVVDTYVSTRTSTGWVSTYAGTAGTEALSALGRAADLGLDNFIDFELGTTPVLNLPKLWSVDGTFLGTWPASGTAIPGATSTEGAFQPSPDFSHLAFSSSNVAFVPNALTSAPGSAYDYDTAAGTTTLISRTPSGEHIAQEPGNSASIHEAILFAGMGTASVGPVGSPTYPRPVQINPGVSTDGSRILMSTASAPGASAPVRLYMWDDDTKLSYDVTAGKYVTYVGMTADGSDVFFLAADALIPGDDIDTSVDLYRWSIDDEGVDSLTLVSVGGGAGNTDVCTATWTAKCNVKTFVRGESAKADSPIAAQSGDVYFYSPERLDGNKGQAGAQNLYLARNGTVRFVAIVDAVRMQVSPDGTHMALVADENLSAYDSQGFDQMYWYEQPSGKIRCVSCDPTGAASKGDVQGSRNGLYMANDGRTFFYTPDALVAHDTNNLRDVYEFVEGRPQLITTGTGSQESQGGIRPAGLVAVSASGTDVYFATYETLVGQDENGQFMKFYDARTSGGFPFEPPPQPCVAADECHGKGTTPPTPPAIVSEGHLGDGGNASPRANGKVSKKKKRKANKKRRHRRERKSRSHSHG